MICYLTHNGKMELLRVLLEPPGGLYPMVKLPTGTNRVQFDFHRVRITSHPITPEMQEKLLSDMHKLYNREREFVNAGHHVDEFSINNSSLLKPFAELKEEVHGAEGVTNNNDKKGVQDRNGNKKTGLTGGEKKPGGSKACVIL